MSKKKKNSTTTIQLAGISGLAAIASLILGYSILQGFAALVKYDLTNYLQMSEVEVWGIVILVLFTFLLLLGVLSKKK